MKTNRTPIYDLWEIVHYDLEHVEVIKVGETSSEKELEQWMEDPDNAGSRHRSDVEIGESLPPHYISFFQNF